MAIIRSKRGGFGIGAVLVALAYWLLPLVRGAEILNTVSDFLARIPEWMRWLSGHYANIWLPPTLIVIGIALIIWDRRIERTTVEHNADAERFRAIAEDDERNMHERLYCVTLESTCKPNLLAAEPFIDFEFAVINSSIFDMEFDRVEGKVHYLNEPMSGALENISAPMRRGKWNKIVLRQWLSPTVAGHMKQHAPAKLGTGNFAVWFTYRDHLGQVKSVRKAFPGDLFSITP